MLKLESKLMQYVQFEFHQASASAICNEKSITMIDMIPKVCKILDIYITMNCIANVTTIKRNIMPYVNCLKSLLPYNENPTNDIMPPAIIIMDNMTLVANGISDLTGGGEGGIPYTTVKYLCLLALFPTSSVAVIDISYVPQLTLALLNNQLLGVPENVQAVSLIAIEFTW
jgi:hypothetical protein